MKKGFTLLELLVVIVIVSVISVSSVIVFGNIDDDTALEERRNIYKDIQKSALLYIDLNDAWLEQFKENGLVYVELSELMNANYVAADLSDPVTNKKVPSNYMIQIYTAKDDTGSIVSYDYVDTCIIDKLQLAKVYCNRNVTCENGRSCVDNDPKKCNCYNETVCDKMSCVANSDGETKNCCLKTQNYRMN